MPEEPSVEREFQTWLAEFRSGKMSGLLLASTDMTDDQLREHWETGRRVREELDTRKGTRRRPPQRRNPDLPEIQQLQTKGRGKVEIVRLRDLQPIPERDLKIDPIDPAQVERIKESIRDTGFWGGVVCCRIDGKLYVVAGWHRVTAAVELGIVQASLFVGHFDAEERISIYGTENASQRGNLGTAPTGTVAAAIHLLAKQLLTTPNLSCLLERSPHSRTQLISQMKNGILGEPIITEFLAKIPGITKYSVEKQVATLKASGEYARILSDVEAEIKLEGAPERDRLREAEATREELDKIPAEQAAARAQKAVAAAAEIEVTFDFKGVSQSLKQESQVSAFRKLAFESRDYLPLDKQAAAARELVRLNPGKRLTVKKIKELFPRLVESVQPERQFTEQEQQALALQDRRRAFESRLKEFMSNATSTAAEGKRIDEMLRDWPVGETVPWPDDFFNDLTQLVNTLNKLYEKGKGSLRYQPVSEKKSA
jgi:hypothetical protein